MVHFLGNQPSKLKLIKYSYLAYETTQEAFKRINIPDSSFGIFFRGSYHSYKKGFMAGAVAEVAAGAFYIPCDIIAQRLQAQSLDGFIHNIRLYNGPVGIYDPI